MGFRFILLFAASISTGFSPSSANAFCSALFASGSSGRGATVGAVAQQGIVVDIPMREVLYEHFPERPPEQTAQALISGMGARTRDGGFFTAETSLGGRTNYEIRFGVTLISGTEVVTLEGIRRRGETDWQSEPSETQINTHRGNLPNLGSIRWSNGVEDTLTERFGLDSATFPDRVLVWSRPYRNAERSPNDLFLVKFVDWDGQVRTVLLSHTAEGTKQKIEDVLVFGREETQGRDAAVEYGFLNQGQREDRFVHVTIGGREERARVLGRTLVTLEEVEGITLLEIQTALSNPVWTRLGTEKDNTFQDRVIGIGDNGRLISIRLTLGESHSAERRGYWLGSAEVLHSKDLPLPSKHTPLSPAGFVTQLPTQEALRRLFPDMAPREAVQRLVENVSERRAEDGQILARTELNGVHYEIQLLPVRLGKKELIVFDEIRETGQREWIESRWDFRELNKGLKHHPEPGQTRWSTEAERALEAEFGLTTRTFWEHLLSWSESIPPTKKNRLLDRAFVRIITGEGETKFALVNFKKEQSQWEIETIENFDSLPDKAFRNLKRIFGKTLIEREDGHPEQEISAGILGATGTIRISRNTLVFLERIQGISLAELTQALSNITYKKHSSSSVNSWYELVGIGENGRLLYMRVNRSGTGNEYDLTSARELTIDDLAELP